MGWIVKKIANDIYDDVNEYKDIKIKFEDKDRDTHDFYQIAEKIESDFNNLMNSSKKKDKSIQEKFKRFKEINRNRADNGELSISYLKLYIAELTENLEYKEENLAEVNLFKQTRNKFNSIITTNYDGLIEDLLGFKPIIGNDLICTNPTQSVYKIHGCNTQADSIIITKKDSENFSKKFSLIKAQLLSLFLHRPIIFIGYSFNDENITDILNTIFLFVKPNSPEAKKIENNFLFIEWCKNENSIDIPDTGATIQLDNNRQTRIKHLRTDNFSSIYQSIIDLELPCSLEDIIKVANINHEILIGRSGDIVKVIQGIGQMEGTNEIGRNSVVAVGESIKYVPAVDLDQIPQVDVITKVKAEINGTQFDTNMHRILREYFRIGGKSDSDYKNHITNQTYCAYSIGGKKTIYTQKWIDFVVKFINNKKYEDVKKDFKKGNTKDIDEFIAES